LPLISNPLWNSGQPTIEASILSTVLVSIKTTPSIHWRWNHLLNNSSPVMRYVSFRGISVLLSLALDITTALSVQHSTPATPATNIFQKVNQKTPFPKRAIHRCHLGSINQCTDGTVCVGYGVDTACCPQDFFLCKGGTWCCPLGTTCQGDYCS
jgi:hypothetical protein